MLADQHYISSTTNNCFTCVPLLETGPLIPTIHFHCTVVCVQAVFFCLWLHGANFLLLLQAAHLKTYKNTLTLIQGYCYLSQEPNFDFANTFLYSEARFCPEHIFISVP